MRTIYVGLTGTISSGKDAVKETLLKKFNGVSFSLSDEIRFELQSRGIEITRNNLRTIANELREKFGPSVLAQRVSGKAGMEKGRKLVLFVSIRNPAEVDFFRKKFGKQFVLVAVDAPIEVRFERARKRAREGEHGEMSLDEFRRNELAEMKPDAMQHEQSLAQIIGMADYYIINDGGFAELGKKVDEFVREFF